jgi:hypothetical protein
MVSNDSFENLIANLDTGLFDRIEAELNPDDRRSLLGLQKAIREDANEYCYLEIGSHLGGSIQPHLLDSKCYRIYSIDKRPLVQADDRGMLFEYPNNSTERMLSRLKEISEDDISKIVCFDKDARHLDLGAFSEKLDICFIDGEHTSQAVLSDFNFCFSVVKADGLICFHDSEIVWKGLEAILSQLKTQGVKFKFLKLGGTVSAIGLGNSVLDKNKEINTLVVSSWRYFVLHQRLTRLQKLYFNHRLINFLKPGLKSALNVVRKWSIKEHTL